MPKKKGDILSENATNKTTNRDVATSIVQAIEKYNVDYAREEASKVDFELERFESVLKEAAQDSDRSAAILIFAFVEDIMLSAIKRHLKGEVKGGWDEITGGNGLLATANDRITLLALLGWIKPNIYNDLRTMKSIRNRFAHHADVNNFDDGKIASWISNLSYNISAMIPEMERDLNVRAKPLTKRIEFLANSAYSVAELLSNLAVAPHANAMNVHPADVEGKTKDEILNNIQTIRMKAAEIFVPLLDLDDAS